MSDKILLIYVYDRTLAKIISEMTFFEFGMPVIVSDTAGEPGYRVEVEPQYKDMAQNARYFVKGVNAVLGRFFNL